MDLFKHQIGRGVSLAPSLPISSCCFSANLAFIMTTTKQTLIKARGLVGNVALVLAINAIMPMDWTSAELRAIADYMDKNPKSKIFKEQPS